jgi:hypothetical protein
MSHTITIPCRECGADIELACCWTPEERNYGADADGRRGICVPGYMSLDDEIPDVCPDDECGHTFTPDERDSLETDAQRACEQWSGQ